MLAKMFRDFDKLMDNVATSTLRAPLPPDSEQHSLSENDAERIRFGFNKNEWKDLLRRLGLDSPGTDGYGRS